MTSKQIYEEYIKYFLENGHKQIPNISLLPEGDSTLLFVNAGMFPLVPYLSGEEHPLGKRLVNMQRCVRFQDIEEVGDNTHTVAFHMLGNWSLGDYFKEDQLNYLYTFLIERLKLSPDKLVATVFKGDENAPRDTNSIEILKEIFSKYGIKTDLNDRIFALDKKSNWWQRGDAVGELGGPDSEVFYYLGEGFPSGKNPEDYENEFIEIGNSVFMQYQRTDTGWKELPQKNVDFGGGLERQAMVSQLKKDIFETDNFWPIIEKLQDISGKKYYENDEVKKLMRIISDHIRSCVFIAMDGITPSNKDQGYILRRLLRRMTRMGMKLGVENVSSILVPVVSNMFEWLYPTLPEKSELLSDMFLEEEKRFLKTIKESKKELERLLKDVDLKNVDEEFLVNLSFNLYQSSGYPLEIFIEDISEKNVNVNFDTFQSKFNELFNVHKDTSRVGSEQKFKGGLADHSEEVIKYHTATHLLQKALKMVLGDHVSQIGSNITGERLRFDFSHDSKLSLQQLSDVENLINEVIKKSLPVNYVLLPKDEAIKSGATFMSNESYPDMVKVYFVGESLEEAFSKEFCGGPHVKDTSLLLPISLYKQEKIGDGKMRIYGKFKIS